MVQRSFTWNIRILQSRLYTERLRNWHDELIADRPVGMRTAVLGYRLKWSRNTILGGACSARRDLDFLASPVQRELMIHVSCTTKG